MTDANKTRSSVSTHAAATVRVRPTLLLMLVRVRAAEATLELGLAEVKKRCADATRRLTRLGATRVEAGEPHADDHANPDPVAKMTAAAMLRRRPGGHQPPERAGVNVTLTGTWDIGGRAVEEVLGLVDRLRFDAAADAEPAEPAAELSPWAGPEEQMRAMMEQIAQATQPPDDRDPKFLFVVRPSDEQLAEATAVAYQSARRQAERLARAAGRPLGELSYLNYGSDTRTGQIMDKQRCEALLAASSYTLQDGEVVSDDPRAAEVTVSVHTSHYLD